MTAHRFEAPIARDPGDGNIVTGHPAERAAWIWTPGRRADETAFLRFSLDFEWPKSEPLHLHVTADNRYQLLVDGVEVSCGPDRSCVAHWAVTSLDVPLVPGAHRLEALVWFIAEAPGGGRLDPKHAAGDLSRPNPPMAQMSYRPGFLLAGDDWVAPDLVDTGFAAWRVADVTAAVALSGPGALGYHDIGPQFHFDLAAWREADRTLQKPEVVRAPLAPNIHGVRTPGWVLTPTPLPEQRREPFSGGRIRAVRAWTADNIPWEESGEADCAEWNALLASGRSVEIPASTPMEILWDFESYECGYPALAWSGGAGATIHFDWAESLYEQHPDTPLDAESPKGLRSEISGKVWLGFGDAFACSGEDAESTPDLWWRSGRYVRLRIRSGRVPLRLERLGILTTGFPLERGWTWESSDPAWDGVLRLIARGLELGAHETWADSPYYEQMTYVGDNVLHMLSNYIGYPDVRLTRRCMELFDWSRDGSLAGLVAERYPSQWRQESATYAMLYPAMLRNHLMWRGDEEFLAARLSGLRQLMDALLALRQQNGLLGCVPGWPFVDWVPTWHQGCGPGVREGDSSIVNLHLVLALQAAATIEDHLGEPIVAQRWRGHTGALAEAIWERYGQRNDGLLEDTPGCDHLSEHAQVFALLTGLLPPERSTDILASLEQEMPAAKCTIYFAHYLLDVLARHGRDVAFFKRLAFWRDLPGLGFTALPESPEPSRSDCHGWGAHPLFHTFASIAGIRPASPGFRTVAIRPMPGPLTHFHATAVHPEGKIEILFDRTPGGDSFRITLPEGVRGRLHWKNAVREFTGALND